MSYLRFSLFYGVSQETKAMASLVVRLDRLLYPDYSHNWDDALLRARIVRHITPQSEVLDLGAGAGAVRQMNFRGLVARVCGVDLDPRILENPMIDEAKIANVEKIPYPDQTFDIVFANNLLEHLQDPLVVFKEVERVLRGGGIFVFKTPNLYHYMPTIARLTSHRFHEWVNRIRGRAESDTFPTHYRANTRIAIERLGVASGLYVQRLERIGAAGVSTDVLADLFAWCDLRAAGELVGLLGSVSDSPHRGTDQTLRAPRDASARAALLPRGLRPNLHRQDFDGVGCDFTPR